VSYAYDVFLSYPRADPVGPWVQKFFHPLLNQWLASSTAHEPRIFLDQNMDAGTAWPSNLKESLRRSKCMIAIWSPQYFRSRWCLAEWQSMLAREQQLGLPNGMQQGLVYPVLFHDGDCFPEGAKNIQRALDVRDINIVTPGYERTRPYRTLAHRVQLLASNLAQWIGNAPPWDEHWPIVEPHPTPTPPPSLPRLS
jgi:hypothetical protein